MHLTLSKLISCTNINIADDDINNYFSIIFKKHQKCSMALNFALKGGTPICLWHPLWGKCVQEPWAGHLKAVDTIGNCQRLAFKVGVSQHVYKIKNLWKFELNRSSNLRDNSERKNTLVTRSCVCLDGWFWDLKF